MSLLLGRILARKSSRGDSRQAGLGRPRSQHESSPLPHADQQPCLVFRVSRNERHAEDRAGILVSSEYGHDFYYLNLIRNASSLSPVLFSARHLGETNTHNRIGESSTHTLHHRVNRIMIISLLQFFLGSAIVCWSTSFAQE